MSPHPCSRALAASRDVRLAGARLLTSGVTRRFRFAVAGFVLLAALAGCIQSPSDGSPGSAGVPVIGLSRLTPEQLVSYYNSRDHPPYRAAGVTIEQLAQMFVDEGNRYQVRGDIAFAQSIFETAWFNYPDCAGCQLHAGTFNYAGIGACDSCGAGFQFSSPLAGVRAQMQLLRNMADAGSRATTIPDPPVPELWGLDPATAIRNFDNYSFKGRAPLWNDMTGVWATSPSYTTTILSIYNQMLTHSGLPGQCPADGLTFGPLVAQGPCPLDIRQPGRAIANTYYDGYYIVNGNGKVSAFGGAPNFGSPAFGSDWARDIAAMPDGNGYVVLSADGHLYRYGSAASPDTLGGLAEPSWAWGVDVARSLAITPDGKGLLILNAFGEIYKAGTAATGPLAALGHFGWEVDAARAIAVTPDARGYVVLDFWGNVWKYGTATEGNFGAAQTPIWYMADNARDIQLSYWGEMGFGYYVVDSWGHVWAGGLVAEVTSPGITVFADRARGITYRNGKPMVLRNDGSTFATK